jgi:hypothetical protein
MIQSDVWAVERHKNFPKEDVSKESRHLVTSQWLLP